VVEAIVQSTVEMLLISQNLL